MPRAKKTAPGDGASYREMRQQLDEVLDKLQDPDCDVDEAAALYEQALHCIARLEGYLLAAENRVQKVQADFAAEEPGA